MKKTLRLLCLTLLAAICLSSFAGAAESADGVELTLQVEEGMLAGKEGLAVDLVVDSGSRGTAMLVLCFTYDRTMLDLVDAAGNALPLPEAGGELPEGQIQGCSDFEFADTLNAAQLDNGRGALAFIRVSVTDVFYYNAQSIGKVFLALKDGADAYQAAQSIRLSAYEEAETMVQSSVVYYMDGNLNDWILGSKNGTQDTPEFADHVHAVSDVHDWDDGTVTREPSCTAAGIKTYTCSACGETRTEEIPAVGHTEAIDKAVAATCTTSGLTEGKHCSVCGEVLTEQQIVPAKGHSWDNGAVTKEPTEETEGEKKHTCTVCGEEKVQSIPVLGHTLSFSTAVTAPT